MDVVLHKKQMEVFKSDAKYILASAGLQSGKTTVGAIKLLAESEKHLNEWIKMGRPQNRVPTYMVVAPTHRDLVTITFPKLLEYVKKGTYKLDKINFTLTMDDGRIFLGRSAHKPQTLISITANGIWADEAGQYKRAAWRELRPRIGSRETYTNTFIIFTTTPNGHNWLYDDIYLRYLEQEAHFKGGRREFEVIQWSSKDNPYFSNKAYEEEKELLSDEEFNARYNGSFTKLDGLVYGSFNPATHIIDSVPSEFDVVIGGIDFADTGTKAAAVIGISKGIYYFLDEYKMKGIEYETFAEKCLQMNDLYQVHRWYADSEDKNGIGILRKSGVTPMSFANKEVREGITSVRRLINGKKLLIYKKSYQIQKEIVVYSYKQEDEGTWNELKPKKGNDHILDCLRYIVHSYRYTPLDKSNTVRLDLKEKLEQGSLTIQDAVHIPSYWEEKEKEFNISDPSLEGSFSSSWNFDD